MVLTWSFIFHYKWWCLLEVLYFTTCDGAYLRFYISLQVMVLTWGFIFHYMWWCLLEVLYFTTSDGAYLRFYISLQVMVLTWGFIFHYMWWCLLEVCERVLVQTPDLLHLHSLAPCTIKLAGWEYPPAPPRTLYNKTGGLRISTCTPSHPVQQNWQFENIHLHPLAPCTIKLAGWEYPPALPCTLYNKTGGLRISTCTPSHPVQ